MKVLVIEDERELAEVIVRSLQKEQFVVEAVHDHPVALDRIMNYSYDCILLDIMLPSGSGLLILKELKALGRSGNVIIISAKDSIEDRVMGLDLGADDYLSKPFHMAELHARVRSVLRRKEFGGSPLVSLADLELNMEDRTLRVNENPLPLNRKEFDMLAYLMVNKGRLVTRTSLAEHVWGDHIDQADDFDFIYSQVKNLRRKLKDAGSEVQLQSVYGIGYKLMAP